jgi:hypothetical protein
MLEKEKAVEEYETKYPKHKVPGNSESQLARKYQLVDTHI